MKITQLKQAIKNPEHVHIYLDGEYWITVTKNALLENQLHKDLEIDDSQKLNLEKESQREKIIEKSIKYTYIRPRTEFEIQTYIKKKFQLDAKQLNEIIEFLKSHDYINDQKFAEIYTNFKIRTEGKSFKKVQLDLMKKGVNQKIKASLMSKNLSEHGLNQKIAQRLMIRGYEWNDIKLRIKKDEL